MQMLFTSRSSCSVGVVLLRAEIDLTCFHEGVTVSFNAMYVALIDSRLEKSVFRSNTLCNLRIAGSGTFVIPSLLFEPCGIQYANRTSFFKAFRQVFPS